jgi:hypothetical protein
LFCLFFGVACYTIFIACRAKNEQAPAGGAFFFLKKKETKKTFPKKANKERKPQK